MAGHGDEWSAEEVRHVLDEACLAAAGRALEHDGQALLVAGAEEIDLVADREVVGSVGAVGESERAHSVYNTVDGKDARSTSYGSPSDARPDVASIIACMESRANRRCSRRASG